MLKYDIKLGCFGRLIVEEFHWVLVPDEINILEEDVIIKQ